MLGGVTLLGCGLFAYPPQPARWSNAFAGGLILLAVAASLRVIVGMQKNALLRRLVPATNGARLDSFFQQVLIYVVLPCLVLLARVFPDVGEAIARRFEPLLTLLR